MPVTIPMAESTVMFELLLLHIPPVVASSNVTEEPIQTCVVPLMADGRGLTVTSDVAVHPVAVL
jgi:hypothetical protein